MAGTGPHPPRAHRRTATVRGRMDRSEVGADGVRRAVARWTPLSNGRARAVEPTRAAGPESFRGTAGDTVDQLKDKLTKVEGASSNNLIGVIRAREADVADWKAKYEQSNKDRTTALTDLGNEQARVKSLGEAHQKTIDTMNADIE